MEKLARGMVPEVFVSPRQIKWLFCKHRGSFFSFFSLLEPKQCVFFLDGCSSTRLEKEADCTSDSSDVDVDRE